MEHNYVIGDIVTLKDHIPDANEVDWDGIGYRYDMQVHAGKTVTISEFSENFNGDINGFLFEGDIHGYVYVFDCIEDGSSSSQSIEREFASLRSIL